MNCQQMRLTLPCALLCAVRKLLVVAAVTATVSSAAEIDPAAIHTQLVVIAAEKAGTKPAVVALRMPAATEDHVLVKGTDPGILMRELLRQALLIAARDELGLGTRDELLGDAAIASGKDSASVDFITVFRPNTSNHVWVQRTEGANVEVLLDHELTREKTSLEDVTRLMVVAEALARAEFPDVLRKLGLDGKPRPLSRERLLPANVEERLSEVDFTDALAAIRDLHAAIRSAGESPARLGALIRGYALLGVLTEFHWHPAHKAFKARALLYAQRLLAREPRNAWGLWHRAYALALAGLHQDALSDLAQAAALAGENADVKPPAWVGVIDACAHCDLKRLKVDRGPQAALAALARLMIEEFPGTATLVLPAARDVLSIEPACFRAIDAMCGAGGVGNLHVATMQGPAALEQIFPQRLAAHEKLPAAVRAQLDQQTGGEVALVDALEKAGRPQDDDGEPSWGVLANMVRETRFVQVYRRLHFMRRVWSVPVHAYWAESHLLVADHPYRLFLETLIQPPRELPETYAKLIERIDLQRLEITEVELIRAISLSEKLLKGRVAWTFAVRHISRTTATPEDARRYLEITAKAASVAGWSRAVAGEALRGLPRPKQEAR